MVAEQPKENNLSRKRLTHFILSPTCLSVRVSPVGLSMSHLSVCPCLTCGLVISMAMFWTSRCRSALGLFSSNSAFGLMIILAEAKIGLKTANKRINQWQTISWWSEWDSNFPSLPEQRPLQMLTTTTTAAIRCLSICCLQQLSDLSEACQKSETDQWTESSWNKLNLSLWTRSRTY